MFGCVFVYARARSCEPCSMYVVCIYSFVILVLTYLIILDLVTRNIERNKDTLRILPRIRNGTEWIMGKLCIAAGNVKREGVVGRYVGR